MNMAVSMTTKQCVDFLKTVTRRSGWWNVKPLQIIQLVEKGQGLKRGEKVKRIHCIQVLSARPERLDTIARMPEYGRREMEREGFPHMEPEDFIQMYCKANRVNRYEIVNRIEFRYYLVEDGHLTLNVPKDIAVCAVCDGSLVVSPDEYSEDSDGTIDCKSFTSWCKTDPLTHSDLSIHEPAIRLWINNTFRFCG